jgi:hypothetical protein
MYDMGMIRVFSIGTVYQILNSLRRVGVCICLSCDLSLRRPESLIYRPPLKPTTNMSGRDPTRRLASVFTVLISVQNGSIARSGPR